MGDSPGNEVAITVTGLKPNHFYNIRVVAVGPNNFRAGSAVVRLRTFGKDGRPLLGDSRIPTSFNDPDQRRIIPGEDDTDDSDDPSFSLPTVEAAPVLDGNSVATRDSNGAVPGQRRNTLNRRHSPSVASTDQPQIKLPSHDGPELSLDELNRKFEGIRKEIDDTQAIYARDEAESQQQEEELRREKDRKKQILKEREEQTTQLKAMIRTTNDQMRVAEKERARMEQLLKDKGTKKSKIRDSISKLESEIVRMRDEREGFDAQKAELAQKRDSDVRKLDDINAELQKKCADLEAELKDKGKQLQDLKATREQLPGAHDEQWREEDARVRRNWDARRKELNNRLVLETKKALQLDSHLRILNEQVNASQQHSGLAFYGQGGVSGNDFDPSLSTQQKRLSHHSTSLSTSVLPSSSQQLASPESSYLTTTGFSHAGFPTGLFMDITADGLHEPQTEAEFRAAGGPLSPSAQTLLPSNIFDEFEDPDMTVGDSSQIPDPLGPYDEEVESPYSSSPSFKMMSSPHGSSHNLPYPHYAEDRPASNMNSSSTTATVTGHRLTNFWSSLQLHRNPKTTGTTGTSEELGPAFGTLKPGQSQSFPRQTDESEVLEHRRRINFSSLTNRNSTGPDGVFGALPLANKAFSGRRLNPFGQSNGTAFHDRDIEGSRPASIASIDMPRPSTDSGSIWGAPGDSGMNRVWSPDNRWASRNGSRRPSLHGSNTVLTTTLASAEDEILDEHDLLDPQTSPSQVGVIGTRPTKSMNQRLNPNAPTFMGHFLRKDRDGGDRDRGKAKEKGKERAKDDKMKSKGSAAPSIELSLSLDDSPADPRMSRDAYSIHTQTSVSESHESLTLDATLSNTPSDVNSNAGSATKDQENVVRKLFRKGSSSKFSLSSRLGKDSVLFKKGPGSASNSDKNMSADPRSSIGDIDDLGEDISQLGRSYDSTASSPSLGPPKSKDGKEGRMSWRFSMKKKGKETIIKEREDSEMDRQHDEE